MTFDIVIGLAVAAGIFGFLIVALVRPGKFQGVNMTDLLGYILYFAVFTGLAWVLAAYMTQVYHGEIRWLAKVEAGLYRMAGVSGDKPQSWVA